MDWIPTLSLSSKLFLTSYSVVLLSKFIHGVVCRSNNTTYKVSVVTQVQYFTRTISSLSLEELMLLRLRVKYLDEEKDNSFRETVWRNLGNTFARTAILCRLLSALFFHNAKTSKSYTSKSPSISLNSKEYFKRHLLTLSTEFLTVLIIPWLKREWLLIPGTGGMKKDSLITNVCAFLLPLRHCIHENKLVMENSQEAAVTLLTSTLV